MTYRRGVCFLIERKRQHVCVRCGAKFRRWQLTACKFNAPVIPPGLGDRVATWLATFGITEARWLWLKSWFLEKPTCGCKKRREALNKFG